MTSLILSSDHENTQQRKYVRKKVYLSLISHEISFLYGDIPFITILNKISHGKKMDIGGIMPFVWQ